MELDCSGSTIKPLLYLASHRRMYLFSTIVLPPTATISSLHTLAHLLSILLDLAMCSYVSESYACDLAGKVKLIVVFLLKHFEIRQTG